jgi:hypothetical protein
MAAGCARKVLSVYRSGVASWWIWRLTRRICGWTVGSDSEAEAEEAGSEGGSCEEEEEEAVYGWEQR